VSVIVSLAGGALLTVTEGDRWTEPPVKPSPIPGVLRADHELDIQTAYDLRREVLRIAERDEPLALGPSLSYEPITESLFIVVWAGKRKLAAFNPGEVVGIWLKDAVTTEDE
jgi:hypothetical protein